MKLNDAGYRLIMNFEGLRLRPYLCSAKIPTIGYGNTYYPNGRRVTMQDPPITREQAFEYFVFIADKFAEKVAELINVKLTQNQFNALVSLAYNIGIANLKKSTLLRLVNNNPNDPNIAAQFARWNRAGGVVVKGLVTRRERESKIYFS